MARDSREVANWFIQRMQKDGNDCTVMQLLKLTYIAHGWHLEQYNSPLITDEIEAWDFGPVMPELYETFRHPKKKYTQLAKKYLGEFDAEEEKFLEQIYMKYGGKSAIDLSNMTHVPGGPWDAAMQIGGRFAKIPNKLIRLHYVDKRAQAA